MDEDGRFPPVPWYAYQREIARADERDKRIVKAAVAIVIAVSALIIIFLAIMSAQQRRFTEALQAQEERWISSTR